MTNRRNIYIFLTAFELIMFGIAILLGFKIKDLQSGKVKGIQYVTKIDKKNLIFDRVNKVLKYFYEPKPNNIEVWKPDWLGYEVKNTINADSLNERKNYSIEKSAGTFRIIVLGDSFTFGHYVNTNENYTEILEDLLNTRLQCQNINIENFEVINLGVYGYDVEYSIERFIRRGLKYQPDLVIWLLNSWNFDKSNEYLTPLIEKYSANNIPFFDAKTKSYIGENKIMDNLKKKFGKEFFFNYQYEAILRFGEFYDDNLIIFSLQNGLRKYNSKIELFVKSNANFKYYNDITDITNIENLHLLDYHPSALGHQRIAEDIFNRLKLNYFSHCKYRN